ncbi:MAG: globin family protein, partial [Acidiferrobacter sp.]
MMNEDLDPFGPHAQHLLGIAQRHVSDINEELISAFYRGLFRHAGPKDVIALLTPEQFAQTQERPLA